MKTVKKYPAAVLVILSMVFLSWSHFNNSKTQSNFPFSSDFLYNHFQLADDEIPAFMNENEERYLPDANLFPGAEDVLVQRIPGDNNHLLMMAFYSKENYSGQFLTLEDGSGIVFRDDGTGFDKKAGDGFYTAKITADVKEFRKQAVNMTEQMKKSNYKPGRFIHRIMVYDPDASESFDVQKFDANEAVSVSGLTDALSSDLSTSSAVTAAATATTLDSIRRNSIIITDTNVVEDPTRTWNLCKKIGNVNGPWTFGTLMRELASPDPSHKATDAQLSTFVKNWLNKFSAKGQVINGDSVQPRLVGLILNAWLNQSQNGGAPAGQLDMRFAPFKLTAIVNRFDLRDGALNSIPGSPCGEGRFVFCVIKSDCSRAVNMAVIFEYGINKPGTCDGRKAWAQQWVNLKNFPLGSSQYNQALQNITDQFTLCGTNTSRPNQSSLDQLRTNEVALAPTNPKRWELRQFVLDSATGNLKQEVVGQAPADKYNAKVVNADVQRMVDYVNKNATTINSETNVVPLTWNGVPFLGGSSHILDSPTGFPPKIYFWNGTDSTNASTFITNNAARFFFSFNTCSGCHSGETQTHFTHVDPVFFGKEATLSGFLTGTAGSGGAIDFDNNAANDTMAIKDAALRPSTNPKIRSFNDIKRRAQGLRTVASTTCFSVLSISSELLFQPLNAVD